MNVVNSLSPNGKTLDVTVFGVKLACLVCSHGEFNHRYVLMNTDGMTFFGLDWLNASADVYVCDACGYLHWFLQKPADLDIT